jgi:hypothetical protein
MGEPIAVLALRRRRDHICGIIAEHERKIKEAQHDLVHVVASLRLFELTGDPSEFPPYIDLNRLLRRGETTKICLATLAAEGPLDTRELAQRVMCTKGLNPGDKVLGQAIALRIVHPAAQADEGGQRRAPQGRHPLEAPVTGFARSNWSGYSPPWQAAFGPLGRENPTSDGVVRSSSGTPRPLWSGRHWLCPGRKPKGQCEPLRVAFSTPRSPRGEP